MSACKTGCGQRNDTNGPICTWCADTWLTSAEIERYRFFVHNPAAAAAALVDFCNRVRAERNNGVSREP